MSTLQSYKRARKLKRTTSRNRNGYWYRDAIEQAEQLHYILLNDHTVELYHYDRAAIAWTPLGEYSKVVLLNEEARQQHLDAVLQMVTINPKVGVGIVLHHVNDFALREGRHKFDDLSFDDLNELLQNSPEKLLDDANASESNLTKRIIPLAAQHKELSHYLVVNVKESYEPFLKTWRDLGNERNLPINTQVFVAPPLYTHYLSRLAKVEQESAGKLSSNESFSISGGEKKKSNHNDFFILSVGDQTSFLAFYSAGKPISYRLLNHFGEALPNQLAQVIQNSIVQVEAEIYDFYYTFTTNNRAANLQLKRQLSFAGQEPVELDWNAKDVGYLELAAVSDYLHEREAYPENLVQSFVDDDPEEIASFPTQKEMKLLNITDLVKKGAVAAGLLFLGLQGYQMYRMISDESWKVDLNKTNILNATLTKYNATKRNMNREESLLEDRSKSWEALEFLVRGFPFSEGFIVDDYNYEMVPISSGATGQVGFVRTWTITGNTNDNGKDRLEVIRSKDEMSEVFKKMELLSYQPEGEFRNLLVDIETSMSRGQNASPSHPHYFRASITQRIEPQDPLSIKIQ